MVLKQGSQRARGVGSVLLRGDGLSVLIETCGDGLRIEAMGPAGLWAWRVDATEVSALRALWSRE